MSDLSQRQTPILEDFATPLRMASGAIKWLPSGVEEIKIFEPLAIPLRPESVLDESAIKINLHMWDFLSLGSGNLAVRDEFIQRTNKHSSG